MGSLQQDIGAVLNELRRLTAADFAALAWADTDEQTIRWKYASGNRNDRYKRIVLRLGKGIAGKVMRSGRPIVMNSFSPTSGDDPREYPILLAENLKSTVSVPVLINGRVLGALLIGCRIERDFETKMVELVCNFAEQLGAIMQQTGRSKAKSGS